MILPFPTSSMILYNNAKVNTTPASAVGQRERLVRWFMCFSSFPPPPETGRFRKARDPKVSSARVTSVESLHCPLTNRDQSTWL